MLRASLALAVLWSLLLGGCDYSIDTDSMHATYHESIPVLANAHVSIENVSGHILVQPWSKNIVDIVAVKHAADTGGLQRIVIEVTRDATPAASVEIRTHYSQRGFLIWNSGGPVDYTVHVPRGTQLRLVNVSGDITANDIGNTISASDISGDVSAEHADGNLTVHTVSGSIDASLLHMSGSRDVSLHSISGDITLAIPRNSGAIVSAHSISGEFHTNFPLTENATNIGSDVGGRIGDGSGSIELESISGSLHLESS